MVVEGSINWFAKLAALLIGVAILGIGVTIFRYGSPVIVGLNKLYTRMPGRFQYPAWWHRFLGAIFIGFGALFAVAGVILAGRR